MSEEQALDYFLEQIPLIQADLIRDSNQEKIFDELFFMK